MPATYEIRAGLLDLPGVARQLAFTLELNVVQMFPIVHGEKPVTFFSLTADMM